jgi:hypothetical protein
LFSSRRAFFLGDTKNEKKRAMKTSAFEWCASLIILMVLVVVWMCSSRRNGWPRSPDIKTAPLSLKNFRGGDIILLEQPFPLTGHLALVIQAPRYGQHFVFEMPNPARRAPDLLKPLGSYLHTCLKKKIPVYVYHLEEGPEVDMFPCVRSLSGRLHYDFYPAFLYMNRVLFGDILGLPGLPENLLPMPEAKDLSHCTRAVMRVLVETGILSEKILTFDDVFVPMTFLDPAFELNSFTQKPFRYANAVRYEK